ncbi:MAG: CoA transferase [Acholeplasmataceae bacterium]|nr:CoA transferase [Acidaminococcaceae bacterium]NLY84386.1 CoA transferase [Acholeplasmataceae bacterium]
MRVLEKIKVIDLSRWLPGQYCGMVLGDFGAEVIKIDDIDGDATRSFVPQKESGMSYWHLALNRNKRGLALDLRTEEGRDILRKLLATADVLIEGFRPGFLDKIGFSYDSVSRSNPGLIYCSITGFGRTGGARHKPAHDLNVVGLAGIAALDDAGSACVADIQVSAVGASMNAVSGILLALLARERTGRGQRIDVSLYNTALGMQATAAASLWGCSETGDEPFGRVVHYYNLYRTKDGKYLTVGTLEPKFWQELCRLLDREDLTGRQFDFAHGRELQAELAGAFLAKTRQEWLDLIGGREFCVTPVCSLEEALASELTTESGMVGAREEDLGTVKYLQPAISLSETPGAVERRAPRMGEHREEILAALGYEKNEIAELANKHII